MINKPGLLLLALIIALSCFTVTPPLPAYADTNHMSVFFTVNPNPAFPGQRAYFNAKGSFTSEPDRHIVKYEWDFGDSTSDTGLTPAHIYTQKGTFSVTLKITDNAGDSGQITSTVDCEPRHSPQANPSVPYTISIGENLHLNGSNSFDEDEPYGDSIVNYEWDINGDGDFSDAVGEEALLSWGEIKDKFNTPAQYPADPFTGLPNIPLQLRVTDSTGRTGITTTTLTIYDGSLVAVPTWGPQPEVPVMPDGTATVHLDGSASYSTDPRSPVEAWSWTIVDTQQSVSGEVADMTVDLNPLPDSFPHESIMKIIELKVTNNFEVTTDSFQVTFTKLPSQPPAIIFDVGREGVFIEQGEGFAVSAGGTTDPDGDWIKSFGWDLDNDGVDDIAWSRTDTNGDSSVDGGDTGPDLSLTMNWAQMGAYPGLQALGQHRIRLTVTDSTDTSAYDTVLLNVLEKALVAKAMVLPTRGSPQTMFTFDGSQSRHFFAGRSIASWQWDFNNDGAFENSGQTAVHTFGLFGVFPVTLQVMDLMGHSDTDMLQVLVSDGNVPPVPDAGGPYYIAPGVGITLEGSGSFDPDESYGDSIVNYQWDINGDGNFDDASGANPTLTDAQIIALGTGIRHRFSLKVTDSFGAAGTASTALNIEFENLPPIADAGGPYISTIDQSGAPTPVNLDGSQSRDPNALHDYIASYDWDTDNDDLYGPEDDPDDYSGMIVESFVDNSWQLGSTYPVSLKVTDSFGAVSLPSETTIQVRNLPPTTNPVVVNDPSSPTPNISWTYNDVNGDPQSQYEVEVWTGGTILWDPAVGTGTDTSVVYAGTALVSGQEYTARVRANDGSSWGGWSLTHWVYEPLINQPPVAEAGLNQTVEQTSPGGAQVILDGSGSTDDGLLVPLTYTWTWPGEPGGSASGMQPQVSLAPGFTRVALTIYDGEFWASDRVDITVEDTTPPNITSPSPIVLEQTSPAGTEASLLPLPTVYDAADPNPTITSNAPQILPPGVTTVTWTATDASGNMATATQEVNVQDTVPPTITAPADITVPQNNPGGATIDSLGTPAVSDVADLNPVVTNDAPTVFPIGVTPVVWTATDASGNSATATQMVTVTPAQNEYTLDVTIIGNGTVNRDNNGPYYEGDTVQLTAVSETGWSFTGWSGDATGSTNPLTITIDGNKSITASFTEKVSPITITSPNGGENWEVFSVQTITWSAPGVSGPVKIQLSRDGGATWATIIPVTPNDGKRKWIVLPGATTQARIKVSSISNPALFDISDANFNIIEASITITSPNGGESWKIGSTQTITWDSTSVLLVKIELSRNGGTTWTTIATGIANHGNKTWKVTGPVTAHARIRVVSLSNSASDISDADFTITR